MSSICRPQIICVTSVLLAASFLQICFAQKTKATRGIISAIKSDSLTDQQFQQLTRFINPKTSEGKWRETAWTPSIRDGRKKGVAQNKPLFLWAMNGDPLGCV